MSTPKIQSDVFRDIVIRAKFRANEAYSHSLSNRYFAALSYFIDIYAQAGYKFELSKSDIYQCVKRYIKEKEETLYYHKGVYEKGIYVYILPFEDSEDGLAA